MKNRELAKLERDLLFTISGDYTGDILAEYWGTRVVDYLGIPAAKVWTEGPCYVLALALAKWLGEENVSVKAICENNSGHAFIQIGDQFLDGAGFKTEQEIKSEWRFCGSEIINYSSVEKRFKGIPEWEKFSGGYHSPEAEKSMVDEIVAHLDYHLDKEKFLAIALEKEALLVA
jgi:hypothetical protein